jgi:hypothetical protein
MVVTLDQESIEAVALRVVELIGVPGEHRLVDAAEIAKRFSVSRDYIYEHADKLGAIPLGNGTKARLRFDPEVVAERLGARPHPVTAAPRRTSPRKPTASTTELLPVKGRS